MCFGGFQSIYTKMKMMKNIIESEEVIIITSKQQKQKGKTLKKDEREPD
jgi:hypothetical protein